MKSTRTRTALALAAGAVLLPLLAGCERRASVTDQHLASCDSALGRTWAVLAEPDLACQMEQMAPMVQVLTVEDTTYESETGALVRVVTRRSQIVRMHWQSERNENP